MSDTLTSIIQRRVDSLPAGLQAHVRRVRDIVVDLAPRHGVDPDMAALGALAHDVARAMPDGELLDQADRLGVPVGVVERQVPLLLHGPVGAELLRQCDGIDCPSLHQAVYWHTTAHPSLDALGKVVFLSDKLDPQKVGRYPYLPLLREMAEEDLDRALLEFLTRETARLAQMGYMVHPTIVEARNALVASRGTEGGA